MSSFARLSLFIFMLTVQVIKSIDLLRLDSGNFELAITNYAYVAVAFLDSSPESEFLEKQWELAAPLISQKWDDQDDRELPAVAVIDGEDPDIAEIVDLYGISLPGVRVFRNSMLYDYVGPYEAHPASSFIIEDSQPSVTLLQSIDDLFDQLSESDLIVVGLFEDEELEDGGMMEGGLVLSPWGHFQAAADALRGLATFVAATDKNPELFDELNFNAADQPLAPPSVIMLEGGDSDDSDDGSLNLWPHYYPGDMLAQDLGMALADWVLAISAGGQGGELLVQLGQSDAVGTSRFFSSSLTKGIAFLTEEEAAEDSPAIGALQKAAETLLGTVSFGYVVDDAFPEVSEYFDVGIEESSVLVAHDPLQDLKFRSQFEDALEYENIVAFMKDVASGSVAPSAKSEPVPQKNDGHVKILVGSNFVEEVSREGVDVMVKVYAPWCMHCKDLAPTYEILGRAFSGEDRIVVAKFDATKNDLPPSIDVQGFPTLLWFPASSKPYSNPASPEAIQYEDPGRSLHDLVGFILKETSLPPKSIRVATAEQLGTLMQEEETLRIKFEEEAQWALRNKDRFVYENELIDFLFGEVIFDGKRWMIGLVGFLFGLNLFLLLVGSPFSPSSTKKKGSNERKQHKKKD